MKLGFGKAFALPTVLIVSVVMIMVLAVSVSATAASRQTLLTQYYDQLAQSAGDAGTAYAKACLTANNNTPTWSSASPLTPNTDCTGTPVSGYPTYVTNYNDVRSSFSVGAPTTDADGRATTIPNSGYVQLLRHSTQSVWKTYTQPTFQSAVVPDLCTAGNTPSSSGWSNAVITTTTATNNIAGAQVIGVNTSNAINPGYMFFRKDFSVSLAGTYTEQLRADDGAEVYVDGQLHWSSMSGYNTIVSNSINLSVGCHSIVVKLINSSVQANSANFSYALTPQGGSTPKMVSDASWRFSTGDTVPFSDYRYYQSSSWQPAVTQYTTSGNGTWAAQAQWPDLTAGWVGAAGTAAGATAPSPQYTYLIDNNSNAWKFSSPTTVKMYVQCDDSCKIYLDNNTTPIMTSTSWTTVTSQQFVIPEGQHRIAVELYNGAGASGFMMTAINTTTNRVIDNTSDGQWTSSGSSWWTTSTPPYSYDSTYLPSPDVLNPRYTLNVLAVAGGGGGGDNGGGGGGAGGVKTSSNYTIYSGTAPVNLPVVVGDGGAGSTSGSAAGSNGSNSIFGNNTYGLVTAYGGGGGASRDGGVQGQTGGSSGGGSGSSVAPRQLSSVAIQGNIGANGAPPDSGCPAGGGGGGGAGSMGTNGVSGAGGNGGYGLTTTIGSFTFSYAGGGVGAITCNGSGSNGAIATGFGGGPYASAATANTGGGGGGGSGDTASDYGGKGGSGFVYVWYLTGTITATATGGTSTTSGVYTILKFTSTTCTVPSPCYVNITALN